MASAPVAMEQASVEHVRKTVLSSCEPLAVERVAFPFQSGRVLAEDVFAPISLPPWDHSSVDGYAVCAAGLTTAAPTSPLELQLVGRLAAGQVPVNAIKPGQSVRILTGAMLPAGADAVIRDEAIARHGVDRIFTEGPVRPGENVRRRGEDIEAGSVPLRLGEILAPGEIAVLTALGVAEVSVHRRPAVSIVPTGLELAPSGQGPEPGKIAGSGASGLAAMAASAGAIVQISAPVRDDFDATSRAIDRAAEDADVVVTTGGTAGGDFDLVEAAFARLGWEVRVWRVAMRPGKPLIFATRGDRIAFALPGNPVASMVSFELFVRPALLRLAGHSAVDRPVIRARLTHPQPISAGVRNYLRGKVRADDGAYQLTVVPARGAASLSSMLRVNALAVFESDRDRFDTWEEISCLLLSGVI